MKYLFYEPWLSQVPSNFALERRGGTSLHAGTAEGRDWNGEDPEVRRDQESREGRIRPGAAGRREQPGTRYVIYFLNP